MKSYEWVRRWVKGVQPDHFRRDSSTKSPSENEPPYRVLQCVLNESSWVKYGRQRHLEWVIQWTEVAPPDHFLRSPSISSFAEGQAPYRVVRCMLDDATTKTGRGYLLLPEAIIAYRECREILVGNWRSTDEEIAIWAMFERIRIYGRSPANEAGLHRSLPGAVIAEGPLSAGAEARLRQWRFDRNEVERFDPCPDGSALAISRDTEDPLFNPSGRFLTFDRAADFLGRYATNISPGGILRDAVARREIEAFHYATWLIEPDKDSAENSFPPLEQGLFAESAVISLARSELNADIQRWDAATRRSEPAIQERLKRISARLRQWVRRRRRRWRH